MSIAQVFLIYMIIFAILWLPALLLAVVKDNFLSAIRLGLEVKKEENLSEWYSQVR